MHLKSWAIALKLTLITPTIGFSATVSAPSKIWTPLAGNHDFLADQQTGLASGDIVGVGYNYGFLMTFNNNGPLSSTDGTFGFRLRLDDHGGNTANPKFDRAAWLGIDADLNGSVDLFLGVNFSGSSAELGINYPGSGENSSPSTTNILSSAYKSYPINSDNYNYRMVDYRLDGGTTNDANPGKKSTPDYYVSVMFDFSDIVAALGANKISITDSSPLSFLAGTATQGNTLNQDLAGVNGGVRSNDSWTSLGGFSQVVTLNGDPILPIPEPSALTLTAIALASISLRRKRIPTGSQSFH